MTGDPEVHFRKGELLEPMTKEEAKEFIKEEVQKLKSQMENNMKKEKQSESAVNQHKRLAMGEKIALNKGGKVKAKSKKK